MSRDQKSQISEGTLDSVSINRVYTEPGGLGDFHNEFKSYKEGKINGGQFKKTAEVLGLRPGEKFEQVLRDPECGFSKVVKSLEKFHKPIRKERINGKFDRNFGLTRIANQKPSEAGNSKIEPLNALLKYQRGEIKHGELLESIGQKNFKKISRRVNDFQDGDFRRAAVDILHDGERRAEYGPKVNAQHIGTDYPRLKDKFGKFFSYKKLIKMLLPKF